MNRTGIDVLSRSSDWFYAELSAEEQHRKGTLSELLPDEYRLWAARVHVKVREGQNGEERQDPELRLERKGGSRA